MMTTDEVIERYGEGVLLKSLWQYARLTKKCQQVAVAMFRLGMSQNEIERDFGLKAGAISRHLQKAAKEDPAIRSEFRIKLRKRGNRKQRFWDFISPEPNSGCWLYEGGDNGHGYGSFKCEDGKRRYAHRISYEDLVGPIPQGMELDHLCFVRCCVNPDHLEPVTRSENVRRQRKNLGRFSTKTHCKKGHEFAGDNLVVLGNGERGCRTCRRAYRKAYSDRKRMLCQ